MNVKSPPPLASRQKKSDIPAQEITPTPTTPPPAPPVKETTKGDKSKVVVSGYCPTGMKAWCNCGATEAVTNPGDHSLNVLCQKLESLGWYLPIGGGRVLCPQCHMEAAQKAGVKSLYVGYKVISIAIGQYRLVVEDKE